MSIESSGRKVAGKLTRTSPFTLIGIDPRSMVLIQKYLLADFLASTI
jgi:hypothetical protein